MNDRDLTVERRAVRLAARRLADETPTLATASAGALRAGLVSRVTTLRRSALAAWRVGVPPGVIAEDCRLAPATVLRWIAADGAGPAGASAPADPAPDDAASQAGWLK